MTIRVKFVEVGEHAKVKIVDTGEDMQVIAVQAGEDIRVKKVESGEAFKVKMVRAKTSSLISYAYMKPAGSSLYVPDLTTLRVFRPLSAGVKKVS